MSAATDLVPVVHIPAKARPGHSGEATILALHRPEARSVAPGVRLTRRGVLVLAVAVAALAGTLVCLAWLSSPAPAGSTAPAGSAVAPVALTVQSGDTLWSIAGRVAPQRDPRAEVATLQHLNHLTGADLIAGQVLRTR